jgi:hypothetical protein
VQSRDDISLKLRTKISLSDHDACSASIKAVTLASSLARLEQSLGKEDQQLCDVLCGIFDTARKE